jgi:DNA repair protein RadC
LQAEAPPGQVLRSATAAYEFLKPRIAHLTSEVFVVLLLDVRLRIIRDVRVAEGTGWACAVQPRDALTPALREGSAAVIFAHNHPSGDATPSSEDRELTRRLVAASELLGVRAVDHLVVAEQGFASLRELGLWDA